MIINQKEKIVKRKEIFLITKQWPTDYSKAAETIQAQIKKLQLDYVDLSITDLNKEKKFSISKLW